VRDTHRTQLYGLSPAEIMADTKLTPKGRLTRAQFRRG
jgi:hypothetical protein